MKKRILSALLVLCLACGLVSTAWAADGDVTSSVSSSPASIVQDEQDENEAETSVESGKATENPAATTGDNETDTSDVTNGVESGTSEPAGDVADNEPDTTNANTDSTPAEGNGSDEPSLSNQNGEIGDQSPVSQPNNANRSNDVELLAAPDYTIEVYESISIQGENLGGLIQEHEWSLQDSQTNVVTLNNTDERTVTVTGNAPGTITLVHKYKRGIGGWKYQTFTVEVSDRVAVYVYVSSKDSAGNSWQNNEEFLDLIGLQVSDSNGFFPAGVIYLDASFLEGKANASALIQDEEDWEALLASLSALDPSVLADSGNNQYSLNKANKVNEYIAQAEEIYGQTVNSGHTALFPWNTKDNGQSYGFNDQTVRYHLDLCFNTNTITFVAGNNGITQGDYQDGNTIDHRVYIRNSTIQQPQNITAPAGYTIEDYYTDAGLSSRWTGVGTPLSADQTVYIKYVERQHITVNYQTVGIGDEVTAEVLSKTMETLNPAFTPQGSTATVPEGYEFAGWYSDPDCNTLVSSDLTFVPAAPANGWEDGATYNYYAKFEKLEPLVPAHQKYVKANSDGTYDLTLNVTGSVDTSTETMPVDVLMILDTSSSMTKNGSQRLANAKKAMKDLIDSLESAKAVDTRYSIVRFDSVTNSTNGKGNRNDASTVLNWTGKDDYENYVQIIKDTIEGIDSGHGTNYQAGLQQAAEVLENARDDAITVVVFLSDGVPTFANDQDYAGNGYSFNSTAWKNTTKAAEALTCDRFYSIGIGQSTESYLNKDTGIAHYVNAEVKDYIASADDEGTDLSKIFAGIAGSVTGVDCSNITITDILSQYAQLTTDAQFTVTITDNKKQTVVSKEVSVVDAKGEGGYTGTLTYWVNNTTGVTTDKEPGRWEQDSFTRHDVPFTLTYDSVNGTFSLFFGDTSQPYALENGWTYSITTTIEPTEKAYTDYRTTGYTDKGDEGTDAEGNHTSSGKDGFYSNASATLDYKSNGVNTEQVYDRPVIQVPRTSLTITKVFRDADGSLMSGEEIKELGLLTSTKFTVKDSNGGEVATDQTLTNVDGVYSVTVPSLYIGGTYTIEETSALEDYTVETAVEPHKADDATVGQIMLVKDATQNKVAFTNTYTPAVQSLTISKTVTGTMASTQKEFQFTVTLSKDNTYYGSKTGETLKVLNATELGTPSNEEGNDLIATVTGNEAKFTFTLRSGEKIQLQVPYGYQATVSEDPDGYTANSQITPALSSKPDGTGDATVVFTTDKDYTIAYTNHLDPVAPTGLESNHTAPYTILVTVAGIAGLALIGGIVARRRRRME